MTEPAERKDAEAQAPAGASKSNGAETPQAAPAESPEIQALRAEAAKAREYLDLARRTQAEFVNWQARARREREEVARYAIESFLQELLPALDGLARTLAIPAVPAGAEPVVEGVRLTEKEVLRIFAKAGVTPLEAVGKPFDPSMHDAVGWVETAEKPEGTVLEEVRRGYRIHDRVLRPAQVLVAKGAAPTEKKG